MGGDFVSLDSWRIFFTITSTSIFDIIDNAIIVAAKDHPLELRLRRDRIVHLLYNHCCPCNPLKRSIPLEKKSVLQGSDDKKNVFCRKTSEDRQLKADGRDNQNEKSKSENLLDDHGKRTAETQIADDRHKVDENDEDKDVELEEGEICSTGSNFETEVANVDQLVIGEGKDMEAVEDKEDRNGKEAKSSKETLGEVSRIKEVLLDSNNLSDTMLLELLMTLQKVDISVEILQATMIGNAVQALRKHSLKGIRRVVHSLLCAWRRTVDEWVQLKKKDAGTEAPPVALNDELHFYPFNEAAPVAPSASAELLQIFEGVDQTEFFSILPRDTDGSPLLLEELPFTDKKQMPVKMNYVGNDITEKTTVKISSHEGKEVNGKDSAEKQIVKQADTEANTISTYKNSRNAFIKPTAPSMPKMDGVAMHKQWVDNEGTITRERNSAMRFMYPSFQHRPFVHPMKFRDPSFQHRPFVPPMKFRNPSLQHGPTVPPNSNSAVRFMVPSFQHRPVAPPWVNNSVRFGQNLQRYNTSRQSMFNQQNRVEETERKLSEGYQNIEEEIDKKRRAIQVIDNQQPKHYKQQGV